MSDITIPSAPVWRPSGSVVAAAVNPAQPGQVIMAWSSGYLTSYGGAPLPPGTGLVIILESGESLVDMQVTNWSTPSGYLLTSRARVLAFGGATLTADRLKSIKNIKGGRAVAFAMDPAATGGGYWINAHGEVFSFGQVPAITTTNVEKWVTRFMDPICKGWSFDWATKRYLLLGANGQIIRSPIAAGAPVGSTAQSKLSSSKFARSIVYNWESGSGYVLDGHGVLYKVGNAAPLPADPHWPSWDVGREILIASWGVVDTLRYYVIDAIGVVHARTRTTKPRVTISSLRGTSAVYRLTTTDASGTIRLGYKAETSRQLAHRSTLAQLEAALNDVLGAGNFSLNDLGASPELDVEITFASSAMQSPLTIRTDTLGTATISEEQAWGREVLTSTARPVISWDYRDAENDAQGAWEVQVWENADAFAAPPERTGTIVQPAWAASGTGDSTRSVKVSQRLTDNTYYRAYVRARERNGLWSDWAYADFETDLVLPPVPDATLTAEPSTASVALQLDVGDDPMAFQNRTLLWWERRLEGTALWEVVRSSGKPISNAFFYDTFDYGDVDALPAPWTSVDLNAGTVGVRDHVARLIDPREATKTFRKVVLAGSHPSYDGTATPGLRDFFRTAADRVENWDLPQVPFSSGGPFFTDDFNRTASTLGTAPDGTPWVERRGAWRTSGTAAFVRAVNGTDRQLALVSTGQSRGAASVTVVSTTTAAKTASLALGVDEAGAGYHLDLAWSDADYILWYLKLRNTAGVESTVDSGVLDPPDDSGEVMQITAELTDTEVRFSVKKSFNAEPFVVTETVSDIASVTPTDGTWWGMGSLSTTPLGAVGFTDFFFAVPDFAPGDADYVFGTWSVSGDGTISALGPSASALYEAEIDTCMTVVAKGGFSAEDRLWVRSGDTELGDEDGLYIGKAGADVIIRKNVTGNPPLGQIPLFESSITDDRLGVAAHGRWLRALLNDTSVPILAGPEITASLATGAHWSATGGTLSATGELAVNSTSYWTQVMTTAATTVHPGSTASISFGIQAAAPGVRGQAFITSYEADGTTEIETFLGPRIDLLDDEILDVAVVAPLPDNAEKIRYGFTSETDVDVTVYYVDRAPTLEIQLPLDCTTGSRWGVQGGTWGQLTFKGLQSVASADTPAWGVNGAPDTAEATYGSKAADLRSVPILTESDAVVLSWPLVGGQAICTEATMAAVAWVVARERHDFIGLEGGAWDVLDDDYSASTALTALQMAAASSFSRRVVASQTPASTLTIPGGTIVEAGQRIAIGVVALTNDGELVFSYEGTSGPVTGDNRAVVSNSPDDPHPGAPQVHFIDVATGGAIDDITIELTDGIVALDWWGVVDTNPSAATPMVAVVGRHESGTDDFNEDLAYRLTTFSNDILAGTRVNFVPVSEEEFNSNNQVGTVFEKVNAALTPPLANAQGTALIESPYPSITASITPGTNLFVGGSFGAGVLIPTAAIVGVLIESTETPGNAAVMILEFIDGTPTPVSLIETEYPYEMGLPVPVSLDYYDLATTDAEPGPFTGFAIQHPSALVAGVSIGWRNEPFRDHEARPGKLYEYRMRTSSPDGEVFSEPVSVGNVTVPRVGYWLKAPLSPELNMRVRRDDDDIDVARTEEQGVFPIPGKRTAIVVSGVIQNERVAPMTLSATTEEERDAILALLNSGETLLFQSPRGNQWYVRFGGEVSWKSLVDYVTEGDGLFQVSVPEGIAVDVP